MKHVAHKQRLGWGVVSLAALVMMLASSCGDGRVGWFDWLTGKDRVTKGKPWTEESASTKPATVPWKGQAVAADTFIRIAKEADLGVVNVGTTQVIKRQQRPNLFEGPNSPFEDFFGGDLFRHFFGDPEEQAEIKRPSLGSGFILNKEGFIVTNNHVVERATEITVTIGQDRQYEAKVVGADPKTDVALIKIEPKEDLHPLVLGNSDELQVGEIVVAIGNPFGLSHTVTQGIVSAKERTIGFGPYDNFIQTDASINPGNSGGPLLNLEAKVVGINTAIVASGQGIGFAIPINLAKNIIMQLKDFGTVTRGWLGVSIQKVDDDLAQSLNLGNKRGALVSIVEPSSPAQKAGIRVRDVIVEVQGKAINDYSELPLLIAGMPVGEKVKINIIRDGKPMNLTVTIAKLDEQREQDRADRSESTGEPSTPSKPDALGLVVEFLSSAEAQRLNLEAGKQGVVVRRVDGLSRAAEKGVRQGDLILEINKKEISSLDVYHKELSALKKGDSVLLRIERPGGTTLYVAISL